MRGVRRVVHGQAAGLITPCRGNGPTRNEKRRLRRFARALSCAHKVLSLSGTPYPGNTRKSTKSSSFEGCARSRESVKRRNAEGGPCDVPDNRPNDGREGPEI